MNYGAITEPINPSAATHLAPRVTMSDDLYRELAEKLRIEAENAETDYTKIIVEAERNGNTYIVEVQALLEFDYDRSPCGRPLAYLRKITPCWVQCETFNRWGDQHPNDFSIEKIKKLL